MSEIDPLVERVDALLKRHQQQPQNPAPVPAAPPPEDRQAPADEPLSAQSTGKASPALGNDDDDIPVLTEVVAPAALVAPRNGEASVEPAPFIPAPPPVFDEKALVAEIESAVIDRLRAELDRSLPSQLNRALGDMLEQAIDGLRADLSNTVRETVREALDRALQGRPDEQPGDSIAGKPQDS